MRYASNLRSPASTPSMAMTTCASTRSSSLKTASSSLALEPRTADERKTHSDRHTPKGQLPASKSVAYQPWHWGVAVRMQGMVPCPAFSGRCVVAVQFVAHAHGTPLSMTSQDA